MWQGGKQLSLHKGVDGDGIKVRPLRQTRTKGCSTKMLARIVSTMQLDRANSGWNWVSTSMMKVNMMAKNKRAYPSRVEISITNMKREKTHQDQVGGQISIILLHDVVGRAGGD